MFQSINLMKNYVLYSRLEATEAKISDNPWILQDGRKINFDKEKKVDEFLTYKFVSTFNKKKIKFNLFKFGHHLIFII